LIPDNQIKELRQALLNSARPLIFFDDDPDGLSSFLQFYKLNPESKGVVYKTAGPLDLKFLKKVDEYQPDTIFILDIPEVAQEFLDKVSTVYWVDHHTVAKQKNVHYYNPMIKSKGKDNRPISYWAQKITQNSLWKAMVGCIGDWFMPKDLIKGFRQQYPDLLPLNIKTLEQALFNSPIGTLARVFSFVLKGKTKSAMTCVKILTRINNPYEILQQTTPQGKYIWKKYKKIDILYQELKDSVKVTKDILILFVYCENRMSLTSDLSNEILYKNPDKFIIIGREKSGEIRCSLRSARYKVLPILENALKNVEGYGGGHIHACGANIKAQDFARFIKNIRKQL